MNTVFFFIYQNLDLTENIALINLNFSMIQYKKNNYHNKNH